MYLLLISSCVVILSLCLYSMILIIKYYIKSIADIDGLLKIINKLKLDSISFDHFTVSDEIKSTYQKGDIGKIWKEFEESLVVHNDKIENTLDADHFFNESTLASRIFNNDFLKGAPNIMVGLGVLFTFIGLVIGLGGLDIGSDDVDSLKLGIESIINGAKISFGSSIAGIFTSMLVTALISDRKTRLRRKLLTLQQQIDFVYPRTNPEKSLAMMREYSRETEMHLGALSETLGEKLQEAVRGVGSEISAGLTASIEPFMSDIANKAMNSSENAFEKLVEEFLDKIGAAGEKQQQLIVETNETIQKSLNAFRSDFLSDVSGLKEVVENLNKSYHILEEKVVDRFDNAINELSKSIQYQSNSTEKLADQTELVNGVISDLKNVSVEFNGASTELKKLLEGWSKQNEMNEQSFQKTLASLTQIYYSNNNVNEKLTEAADKMTEPFSQLRSEYELMRSGLESSVNSMSNKMNDVLNNYFSQVEVQTNERMSEWNNQTSTFSSAMLDVTNELNNIIQKIKSNKN